MKKSLVLAAILSVSAVSFASDAEVSAEMNFKNIDANIDGVISIAEAAYSEALVASFAALDMDKDDLISELEFAAVDTDQNGLVSEAELSMLSAVAE